MGVLTFSVPFLFQFLSLPFTFFLDTNHELSILCSCPQLPGWWSAPTQREFNVCLWLKGKNEKQKMQYQLLTPVHFQMPWSKFNMLTYSQIWATGRWWTQIPTKVRNTLTRLMRVHLGVVLQMFCWGPTSISLLEIHRWQCVCVGI